MKIEKIGDRKVLGTLMACQSVWGGLNGGGRLFLFFCALLSSSKIRLRYAFVRFFDVAIKLFIISNLGSSSPSLLICLLAQLEF